MCLLGQRQLINPQGSKFHVGHRLAAGVIATIDTAVTGAAAPLDRRFVEKEQAVAPASESTSRYSASVISIQLMVPPGSAKPRDHLGRSTCKQSLWFCCNSREIWSAQGNLVRACLNTAARARRGATTRARRGVPGLPSIYQSSTHQSFCQARW